MKQMTKGKVIQRQYGRGFTLLELVIVLLLVMVVMGISLPKLMTGIHDFRLHGAGYDFSGVAQASRWRSVQDDRFYSVRFIQRAGG